MQGTGKRKLRGNRKLGIKKSASKPKPEEKKVWQESQGSKVRRKALRIGAALAELAGGTDYAKEAASGEPIELGKKDEKKKKNGKGKGKGKAYNYAQN